MRLGPRRQQNHLGSDSSADRAAGADHNAEVPHRSPVAPAASSPLPQEPPWSWRGRPAGRVCSRALKLFVPISAAITLVLVPMVLLYEQSRREALQSRLTAMAEAGSLRVQSTLQEITGDAGVTATHLQYIPLLTDDLRLRQALNAQLVGYERYRQLLVVDGRSRLLAQVSNGRPPPLAKALSLAGREGLRLSPGQQWMSPVIWPQGEAPALVIARPLHSPAGQRLGVLLAVASLEPLVRDLDRSANVAPSLERAYLLSANGRILNRASGTAGQSFAARFPRVWAQIQRRIRGVVTTEADGLFVFDRSPRQDRLAVVIQLPPHSLLRTSVFGQPTGLALVLLLYLLAAGASVGLAISQERLALLGEEERATRERLQSILRSTPVGMCLCDPISGTFLSVNGAMCSFFARSESELLACTWQQLTHPQDLATDQQLAAQLQRGDFDQYRLRKRFLRPDGSTVWGDLAVSCTRHGDGSVRDLIAQISDVSELVSQKDYLEAAADAGVVGVWDWDVPRDVLTWDAVMYKLYGRRPDQFAGAYQAWADAIHPEDRAATEAEIQAALQGWRPYQPRFRVIWPDGSIHHLQARSRTSYGPDGTPLRMIGVNYDITEEVVRQQEVEQQRLLLATTLDALLDPLLFLTLELNARKLPELHISELNPAAATFFARTQAQLVGRPLARVLPAHLNRSIHKALLAVVQSGDPFLTDEQPIRLAEGLEPRHVDLRAAAVRDGVVVNFRDVSERRRAMGRLAASEEHFRLLAENVTDVVFLSEAGRITWMSPGLDVALGWPATQWIGRNLTELCHPEDRAEAIRQGERVEAGERVIVRLRLADSQGCWHWVELHAGPNRSGDGQQHGAVVSFRIVDDEVLAAAELDRRARIDPLTGLLNRQEILERLERLTSPRQSADRALAVLFCDIDHFKAINDRHGHGGGDTVLRTLAERLKHSTRRGDLVGRIGGDELLVVLLGIQTLQEAQSIATKIHATARQPLQLASGIVEPTLSIGVTLITPREAIDAVVARADQAMYEAKQGGRDRVVAFTAGPPTADA